jgi:hypothetical protein
LTKPQPSRPAVRDRDTLISTCDGRLPKRPKAGASGGALQWPDEQAVVVGGAKGRLEPMSEVRRVEKSAIGAVVGQPGADIGKPNANFGAALSSR